VKIFLPDTESSDDEEIYVVDEKNGIRTSCLNVNTMDDFVVINEQKIEELFYLLLVDYDKIIHGIYV